MNKFYSMIGIARKGGNLVLGYDTTVSLLKTKIKDVLVIIAKDASEKTRKNIIFECDRNGRRYIEYGDKVVYGKILNKREVSVLAVTEKNIMSYLLENNT